MYPKRVALTGHVSPETAYVIEDYPYGRLRCRKRVWIETTKHGQRLMEQTTDPKRGNAVWNKPHASTYTEVMVMYLEPQEDGRQFVQTVGLDFHADDARITTVRLLVGDDALRASGRWDVIEQNHRTSIAMNNRYRKPEEQVTYAPMPSWSDITAAQATASAA